MLLLIPNTFFFSFFPTNCQYSPKFRNLDGLSVEIDDKLMVKNEVKCYDTNLCRHICDCAGVYLFKLLLSLIYYF